MSEAGKCAYITGGASGIGRAMATRLVEKGAKVYIADLNQQAAESVAAELNKNAKDNNKLALAGSVDVADWDKQVKSFSTAIKELGGRIDYVFPIAGIGERAWIPPAKETNKAADFIKPDLACIDVDLTAVLYTVTLAIQHFRKQKPSDNGFRGKIGCVASVCGIYCVPTLAVYTAAKHGVLGFVRSYGKYSLAEGITVNAVCPNVVRTNISTGTFYDKVEDEGILTPIATVIDALDSMLGKTDMSGETLEAGPNGPAKKRVASDWLDEPSKRSMQMAYQRSYPMYDPDVKMENGLSVGIPDWP